MNEAIILLVSGFVGLVAHAADDSCQFANDGECDEPNLCAAGTDLTDCGVYEYNCVDLTTEYQEAYDGAAELNTRCTTQENRLLVVSIFRGRALELGCGTEDEWDRAVERAEADVARTCQ